MTTAVAWLRAEGLGLAHALLATCYVAMLQVTCVLVLVSIGGSLAQLSLQYGGRKLRQQLSVLRLASRRLALGRHLGCAVTVLRAAVKESGGTTPHAAHQSWSQV